MKVQESQGHMMSDRQIINGPFFQRMQAVQLYVGIVSGNCTVGLISSAEQGMVRLRDENSVCLFIIYLKLGYLLFCLIPYLVLLNRAVDRYRLLADLDEWLLHRGCKTLRFVSSPGLSHPSALR